MTRIFISYSRRDKHITQQLTELLRYGFDVWYDTEIPGGVEWWKHIVQQIRDCDCFIFLLSPESVTSKFCLDEFQEAQQQDKFVVPVLVRDSTQLPDILVNIQFIQLFDEKNLISAEGISRIYGGILKYLKQVVTKQFPIFDITVARRQADLRLLNQVWEYLSVDSKLFLEGEFSSWHINYDNYKSHLVDYLELTNRPEFAFNSSTLDHAFTFFNEELSSFANWLQVEYEITGNDGKAVLKPKVRRVKEYLIYEQNAGIYLASLRKTREKLIRTIKMEYPEFEFNV